ncbi:MAG: hypothetical protein WBA74_19170 [Cyclobacteriaceae bacterium]
MEEWKDKVLSSLERIERAKPPTDTFDKIASKITNDEQSSSLYLKIAATIALFLLIDVLVLFSFQSTTQETGSEADHYSSVVSNYNLYDR